MAGPIRFVCVEPQHQHAPEQFSNSLTIHENRWAFCPAGTTKDHVWQATEPTTVDALRRAARAHDVHA